MKKDRFLILLATLLIAAMMPSCSGVPTDDEFGGDSEQEASDGGDTEEDTSAEADSEDEDLELEDDTKVAKELNEDKLLDEDPVEESNSGSSSSDGKTAAKDEDPIADNSVVSSNESSVGASDNNEASSSSGGIAQISNIRFEANEGAGSIIIEGSKPLEFSSRNNESSNQYIIEIQNAKLPKDLTRPFITKDFQSQIGSIDAYQNPGSDSVNVVIQLRSGAGQPSSHSEGSSIIVVPSGNGSSALAGNSENSDVNILSSRNLDDFLSANLKFYGKKISIEVQDIDVRSAINLIAEETGANLVMSDSVTGKLAIKLKDVPWDQALALILRTKKLGYTRQGNVLRISPMSEIKQEEEDTLKMAESRRKVEPLKVQMIPINYAKISELQGQLKPVMSDRGSIVADSRTNSIIVTDTEEILDRAKKIISSLDLAPAQVLIEGKLVEARENFNKRVGINWGLSGMPVTLGDGANGPMNLTPNLNIRPSGVNSGSLGFSLTMGTLDVLGDINAVLSLEENEENVRVISSPRIVTLHNEQASITQSASVPVLASVNMKDGTKSYKDLNLKMDLRVTPEIANNGVVQLKVDITREFLGSVRDDGSAGSHHRTASTKVMVKSGQTAVIGGIYQNDSSQLEGGVPWLKEIPIIGFLFRGRSYHKDKTELLLFLTPRVLSQAGAPVMAKDLGEAPTSKE